MSNIGTAVPAQAGIKASDISLPINDKSEFRGFCSVLGVAHFLGIQFAHVPARFSQAQLVEPGSRGAIVEATKFGPICPQMPDGSRGLRQHLFVGAPVANQKQSEENCLCLNIYAPQAALSSNKKIPVIVWIHGAGDFLVQHAVATGKPVIFVSINYRHGHFGFSSSSELTEEAVDHGELGWANIRPVQNYIYLFGGDNTKVLIAGESAGACILQSAPFWSMLRPEDAQERFNKLVQRTGVPVSATAADKLAALRSIPPEVLNTWNEGATSPVWDPKWFVGHDNPEQPLDSTVGEFPAWVQAIVSGTMRDEMAIFGFVKLWQTKQLVIASLRDGLSLPEDPSFCDEVLQEYVIQQSSSDAAAVQGLVSVLADACFTPLPFNLANNVCRDPTHSPPVYIYRFDQPDEDENSVFKGSAYHVLDNTYTCRYPAVAGPSAPRACQATVDRFSEMKLRHAYGEAPWQPYRTSGAWNVFDGENTRVDIVDHSVHRWEKLLTTEARVRKFARLFATIVSNLPSHDNPAPRSPRETPPTQAHSDLAAPSPVGGSASSLAPSGSATADTASNARTASSLSSMFQRFVSQRSEECLKAGLVLSGEPSPLTFALQLRSQTAPYLHDTSYSICNSWSLEIVQDGIHPEHLEKYEIDCLKAKGAFDSPEPWLLSDMINVFLDRFYPYYPVVNPGDLLRAYEERKIPWILLQSICFIAMTFGDLGLVYRAGFTSRKPARRLYYNRAKALFDFNYENNKIILLKVAILLSFHGPQMDCYWNPSSWIEVGATVGVSLGLHRRVASLNHQPQDRSLLRRLWWILVLRDAHCSSLLGRPFRINMTQSDIDMMSHVDFVDTHAGAAESSRPCDCKAAFDYQIRAVELQGRFICIQIQRQLDTWKSRNEVGAITQSTTGVHLDILWNYHRMLLYMSLPGQPPHSDELYETNIDSAATADSSAFAISSAAVKLVLDSSLCTLPHELFPAFFVAGILLYQQAHNSNDVQVAKMARASFDNCQMALNGVQDFWDPGKWAMTLFTYLLSEMDVSTTPGIIHSQWHAEQMRPDILEQRPGFIQDFSWAGVSPNTRSGLDQEWTPNIIENILLPDFFSTTYVL
ncbi:transcriptional regulator family: Fungal Specific TF [Aspergillus niger]|nr:transcriptional regulator family: Fungal Specific TF [Aspergillus niger]